MTQQKKDTGAADLLFRVLRVADLAAAEIQKVQKSRDFKKKDKNDGTPVTEADRAANAVIVAELPLVLDVPILSEESSEGHGVRDEVMWVVDPLDGTKDFLKGFPEYTVNIALVERGIPTLGVVVAPATGQAWIAKSGIGAFARSSEPFIQSLRRIEPTTRFGAGNAARVAVSRSHLSETTLETCSKLFPEACAVGTIRSGSSIKICMVADGTVHAYLRDGPTMEWDTAAADAVLRVAGGGMFEWTGLDDWNAGKRTPLVYGKNDLHNPFFLAWHQN